MSALDARLRRTLWTKQGDSRLHKRLLNYLLGADRSETGLSRSGWRWIQLSAATIRSE